MANTFTIPKNAYPGFSALIQLGPERLGLLADAMKGQKLTLDVAAMTAKISKDIQVDADQLQLAFDRVLIPLSGLRAELKMPAEGFVELLTESIKEQGSAWLDKEANHDKWPGVASALKKLVGPDSFFELLNKAYRLLVTRPALVDGIRVLTELRPVYDDDVVRVHAYLITSTLAVSYQEFGEQKRMHLTVDRADLLRLQEQVERSLKKIELLEKQVALLGVPSLVAGIEEEI